MARRIDEHGSASVLAFAVALAAAFLVMVLTAVGASYVAHAELQQAADVAAASLRQAGADSGGARATSLARANGARKVAITAIDGGARLRVRTSAPAPRVLWIADGSWLEAEALVEVPTAGGASDAGPNPPGFWSGPLVGVDVARVCPAVASAYGAMERVAARDGVALHAISGFRSWQEQAALYARLGPALAAPPGTSRHHDATELDIAVGPAGSPTHRWLQANAPAHGFVQRYSWEPWHWGFVAGC